MMITVNWCDIFTGTNGLNQNETIVVASIIIFVVTSIVFFLTGLFCGHFCRKQNPISTTPSAVDPREDVSQPKRHEKKLELQTNVAYASVQ
jgi:thiosulfate reductase cytochrome b subunit